jgi:hypothetical protein
VNLHDTSVSLAAIVSIIATISSVSLWVSSRVCRKNKEEIIAATTGAIQKFIGGQLESLVANRDPKSYYTLELLFPGGESLRVPMIPGCPVTVLENISVGITSHTKQETIGTLVCKGFGHIPSHAHAHHHETVTVISGIVTDLITGRIYREGETWEIPPGEFHSATFHDCVLILRYHPPLLTAHERPVDLAAMGKVFPLT